MDLPDLGAGIVYSSSLDEIVEAAGDRIDVLEIEPQLFWFNPSARNYVANAAAYDRFLRFPQPKILHGVGFPVGGSSYIDDAHIPTFVDTIRLTGAPWVSEHLSFNRVYEGRDYFNTGFLLPPLQTLSSVESVASNISRLRAQLGTPFAFETGVNYLRRQPYEMSDGDYFTAVAEEADCGILLDLHNLWCNEKNGRESVLDVIDKLPLDRVWEVHLAGGKDFRGYWLDAHSGLVPRPVMQLAEKVIPRLPNLRAIMFEIIGDYLNESGLGAKEILEQLSQIRKLWALRRAGRTGASRRWRTRRESSIPLAPGPEEWEVALGGMVVGRQVDTPLADELAQDPGISVYKHLVQSVRAGMLVESLRLTYRYLVLNLGEKAVRDLLQQFWNTVPPETFTSEEAGNFAAYLYERTLGLPHIDEVLGFEIATQQVLIERTPKTVPFTCDPITLLESLRNRQLPADLKRARYELTIEP